MFDFSIVTQWIDAFLREYMPEWGALLIEFVLIGVALLLLYALIALALIYGDLRIFPVPSRSQSCRTFWNFPECCRYGQDPHQGAYYD